MQFDQFAMGEYRIFTGALESPVGDGYIAALIILRSPNWPREVFRDESLACGHRWESADAALAYAMAKSREVIRCQETLLAA